MGGFYYKNLIPLPTFYMSSFFETTRDIYLQKLSNISTKNEWTEWISYFLEGVIAQAKINTMKANNILMLYNSFKNQSPIIKSAYFIPILDFLKRYKLLAYFNK